MTNDTDKIVQFSSRQDSVSKYELLKSLMGSKEQTKTENTALRKKALLIIIVLLAVGGLYWRSQLGYRPASNEEVLSPVRCQVVGNISSKLYHIPGSQHYLELLQRNKQRENRICFSKEWQAFLAGYSKSKF